MNFNATVMSIELESNGKTLVLTVWYLTCLYLIYHMVCYLLILVYCVVSYLFILVYYMVSYLFILAYCMVPYVFILVYCMVSYLFILVLLYGILLIYTCFTVW